MKTIEDLGISPAPWRAFGEVDESDSVIHYVHDANGKDINKSYLMQADACLISAAPELYERLRDAVIDRCRACAQHRRAACDKIGMADCYVTRWKSVLAKASGEETK